MRAQCNALGYIEVCSLSFFIAEACLRVEREGELGRNMWSEQDRGEGIGGGERFIAVMWE